jgi:predicted RNase H-like nuclease (RuvC/YqgF family)
MKKPTKKTPTLAERMKKLEELVKRQEKRIRELEREVKRLDIEEITELDTRLNSPMP